MCACTRAPGHARREEERRAGHFPPWRQMQRDAAERTLTRPEWSRLLSLHVFVSSVGFGPRPTLSFVLLSVNVKFIR